MKNSPRFVVLALSALALLTACEDDPAQPAAESSEYLPLTTRNAVLSNLEVAWGNRATDRIDDLLDDEFTFYFHPADIGVQWSRADEIAATERLFTSNSVVVPTGPVCRSIRLDLSLDEVTWDPIAPTTNALSETWYTATVYYSFTFQMEPDKTYVSEPGARAQLTVREVAVEGGTEWRLVEWRDLGNDLPSGRQTASADERTWGAIKALYLAYATPTTRTAVLHNLEVAWNRRSTDAIDDLLDENFTFFFAPGDVGGSIPAQWARTDELQATNYLFISNSQPVPTGPVCTSVRVDLAADNLQWIEIIPEEYPSEYWYATIVFYSATFRMEPDQTYIVQPGAKVQFTVRNVGSDAAPHYQLVEWRDLGSSLLTSSHSTADMEETTWGGIKAFYQ